MNGPTAADLGAIEAEWPSIHNGRRAEGRRFDPSGESFGLRLMARELTSTGRNDMPDWSSGAPQIGHSMLGRIGPSRPGVPRWQDVSSGRGAGAPAYAVGLLHVPAGMPVREWQAARGMVRIQAVQCGYWLLETFDITDHSVEMHATLLAVDRLMVETGAVALVVAGPVDGVQLRDLLVRNRAELVHLPYDNDLDTPHTRGPILRGLSREDGDR